MPPVPARRDDQIAPLSRRHFLQLVEGQLLAVAAWNYLGPTISAAADAGATGEQAKKFEPLHRFPRMVHEYYVDLVRQAEAKGMAATAPLKTRADGEAYVREVQSRLRECFGPEPERTPLNARTIGTVDRDAYTIERVIFESRPNFPVTANLYLPKGHTSPRPAVLGNCGHSDQGKAYHDYQPFAQSLARFGYVVLMIDPISQGERAQEVTEEFKAVYTPVAGHQQVGNQQHLVGEFLGAWMAWDGIRGIDYLLTRPEVDGKHIGVTGNSGGGTHTVWMAALERRLTMAAPSCFVSTLRHNIENELASDSEQYPPGMLARGLDESDCLAAAAPKPVIVLGKDNDFFDLRALYEVQGRLDRLYHALGHDDQIDMFIGHGEHGYSIDNREAMYGWFNRFTGIAGSSTEPAVHEEEQATLWCTSRGQVASLDDVKMVQDFTAEKSRALAARRGEVDAVALRERVPAVLKLPADRGTAPDYRIWTHNIERGYPTSFAGSYTVTTEPGIESIVYKLSDKRLFMLPPNGGPRATLYIAHHSSDAELRDEPLLRELYEADRSVPFFTCDVRGIGESQPDTGVPQHASVNSDYFYAGYGILLDRPYIGQRTFDVLRVLDWLADLGHTEVHLVGKGNGALLATYAGLLHDNVKQVTLKNSLTSYADVAETIQYNWPFSAFPRDVLAHFDLPDCYRALEAKQLRQIEPWGATDWKK